MNDPFQLEVEDARALIREMRRDPDTFSFERQEYPPPVDDFPTHCYAVLVECNGKKRHYQGGYGLDWVHHLEFDLCRSVFGPESSAMD